MLKLQLALVLLLVGQNHAKLSASSQRQLAEFEKMLAAEEKEERARENQGYGLRYMNNMTNMNNMNKNDTNAGNYQLELGQLLKGVLGQLTSGKPVKMIVDIKNPEVMTGEDGKLGELGTDITALQGASRSGKKKKKGKKFRAAKPSCCPYCRHGAC